MTGPKSREMQYPDAYASQTRSVSLPVSALQPFLLACSELIQLVVQTLDLSPISSSTIPQSVLLTFLARRSDDGRPKREHIVVCPPVAHTLSTGLTGFISPDEALPPFPNPSAHIEFYKLFKRESDEYDNDFIKKYDDEANTTLIFVSFYHITLCRLCQSQIFLSDRPGCSPRSHPLSLSTFRASSNLTTHK